MALPEASSTRRGASSTSDTASASRRGGAIARRSRSDVHASGVTFEADRLRVDLTDGRSILVPLAWFPRLADASSRARQRFELIGDGTLIHWPDVDEDIDVENLLRLEGMPRR